MITFMKEGEKEQVKEKSQLQATGNSGVTPPKILAPITKIWQANIILTMCCVWQDMGMFMPNMYDLMMDMLSGPFWSLKFLLLTNRDPSNDGFLNLRMDCVGL